MLRSSATVRSVCIPVPADSSCRALQIAALIRGDIVDLCVLAELQCPDVGRDAPSIVRFNARGVTRHRAEAIRNYVEEVTHRRLAQFVGVIRSRLPETSPHDHAVPVT